MPRAGMVSRPIKCTPKDKPKIKAISNNQRSPLGVFMSCSQRRPNQKSKDKMRVAMAYTSASTALNQKLSEKQKASAPTAALPKKLKRCGRVSRLEKAGSFRNKSVSVQNKNNTVKALENTDMAFTIKATFSGPEAKLAKNAPII